MSTLSLFLLLTTASSLRAVLLNEILANPAGSEYTDEYVELLQEDSTGVDLAGWRLSDGSAEDELLPWQGGPTWLAPGALALVLDPGRVVVPGSLPPGTLLLTVPDEALGSGGLSNSQAEPISLITPQGEVADLVWTRPELPENISLERRTAAAFCDSCWQAGREEGGTPGAPNSVVPRDWELRLLELLPGCRVAGSGRLGFRGTLRLEAGVVPCLVEEEWGPLELEPGAFLNLALPPLPLAGVNPARLTAADEAGGVRVLADTLLWAAPLPGALYLEGVQPAGEDWIQVASASPCPVLLDGLALESRSFSHDLTGLLPPDGRLLAGLVEPACPTLHDPRSLSLALSGWARLLDPQGRVLDEAFWPEGAASGAPWRRLDPAQPGDQAANWAPQAGLQPGCIPDTPRDSPPSGNWQVSTRVLDLGSAEAIRLAVSAPAGVAAWRLELWTLDGRPLLRREAAAPRLYWDGRLAEGRDCPAGLYLLRLAGAGREQVQPLAVVRRE